MIKNMLDFAIPLMVLALTIPGCGGSEKQPEQVQQVTFVPVDSLLGERYAIPKTDKQFRPPIGFEAASDTILDMLRAQLARNLGDQKGVEMVQCYLDTIHTAGLMISTIEGINFGVDTTGFLERYRAKLHEIFNGRSIDEDNFWSSGVLIKRFFVTDSILVRVQLICLSDQGNAVELTYFTPREQYPDLVTLFESSIGSIELASQPKQR